MELNKIDLIEKIKNIIDLNKKNLDVRTTASINKKLKIPSLRITTFKRIYNELNEMIDKNLKSVSELKTVKKILAPSKKIVDNYVFKPVELTNDDLRNIDKLDDDMDIKHIIDFSYKLTNDFKKNIDILFTIIKKIKIVGSSFKKFLIINDKYYIPIRINMNPDDLNNIFVGIEGKKSDMNYVLRDITIINSFKISSYDELYTLKGNVNRNGAFFNMFLKSKYDINLDKYQIFKKRNFKLKMDECFINCLKLSDIDNDIIKDIKIKYFHLFNNINNNNVRKVATEYKLNIKITYYDEIKQKTQYLNMNCGNKSDNIISIGLINNHYFINEITPYSEFYIKNMLILNKFENKYNITELKKSKYPVFCENSKMNSYNLIKYLYVNKDDHLTLIDTEIIEKLTFESSNKNIEVKHFDDDKFMNMVFKDVENREDKTTKNIMFDIETNNKSDNSVNPYLINFLMDNSKIIIDNDGKQKLIKDGKNDIHISANKINIGLTKLYKYVYENYMEYDNEGKIKIPLIRLIAHNANFDVRFLQKYVYVRNMIYLNNRVISLEFSGYYKNVEIRFKTVDFYLFISKALKKIPEMFGNNIMKEVMPYDIYTEYNISNGKAKINDVEKLLNKDDLIIFKNNLEKWGCIDEYDNNYFNIILYSKKYCEIDCVVLRDSYNSFKKQLLEDNDLKNVNIDNYLTLPSISYDILMKYECFEGVKQLSGAVQKYISLSNIGGRVMSNNNNKIHIRVDKKGHTIEKHKINCDNILKLNGYKKISNDEYEKNHKKYRAINDFDGVSLYPSAMSQIEGLIKGKSHHIEKENLNMEFLNSVSYYFITIKINTVGKELEFPHMCLKNTGINNFSNNIINEKFVVNKTQLEDLIINQQITYDIINGVYFNDGFNKNIVNVMNKLFELRKKHKKDKNKIEETYKLLLNSMYGKMGLKPSTKEYKLFNNVEEKDEFLNRHFDEVSRVEMISDKKSVVIMDKRVNKHYNQIHNSSYILAMSKRIMNNVFKIADDNDIKIFYQDTDSIHLFDDSINIISNEYKKLYGKDLIGENLSQFHSDFKLKGCNNVKSKQLIILGKKTYIDELYGTDDNENEIIGYHMRMKGINESGIYDRINIFNNKSLESVAERIRLSELYHSLDYLKDRNYVITPIDIYKILFEGEGLSFNLLADNKIKFKLNICGAVNNMTSFIRNIKFEK